MIKTISSAEARQRFAEITDDVAFNGAEYIILKNGKEVAKIGPPHQAPKISPQFQKRLTEFSDQFTTDLELLANS